MIPDVTSYSRQTLVDPSTAEPNAESKQGAGMGRYPALKIIRITISVLGYCLAGLGALGTLVAFVNFMEIYKRSMADLIVVASGFSVFVTGLLIIALAEIARVIVDIENNTREIGPSQSDLKS